MATTFVSFIYRPASSCLDTNELLEREYQKIFKPLGKFLFAHPGFHFSLYFPGNRLQFYRKKRPEFITLLKQLLDRNQIEVLGGAFYDPVLPLLYTADRNGQLDLLSSEIRQTLGKRPRGCSLYADCWESSLVSNLTVCGFDYVFLDNSCVPAKKQNFLPLNMSYLGKSIEIFPLYNLISPVDGNFCDGLIQRIQKHVTKIEKKGQHFQQNPDRILCVDLRREELETLIAESLLGELNQKFDDALCMKTTLPSLFKKSCTLKEGVFINSCLNKKCLDYPFERLGLQRPDSFYDFQEEFASVNKLYSRILYVGMLVSQYKNDKMRKTAAREKLWQGQNGRSLLESPSAMRQQSYKLLMEAEKILREDNAFKESLTCFDYNSDGIEEYVCRMSGYFACISAIGGSVQELDPLRNAGNYADTFAAGGSNLGIFVDHIFTQDQFESYRLTKSADDGVFSKILYGQIKFSQSHHELQLAAKALFGPQKQRLLLKKKYIINSTGMLVQYILRNESEKPLNAIFAVESNISHTRFSSERTGAYSLETASDDQKFLVDTSKDLLEQNDGKPLSGIDSIRLSDIEGCVSFTFEPNEKSQLLYFPRPSEQSLSFVCSMLWDVSIEPGKEIEKTVTFTITSLKKERRAKITQ